MIVTVTKVKEITEISMIILVVITDSVVVLKGRGCEELRQMIY